MYGLADADHIPNALGMTETLGPHSACPVAPLPPGHAGSFGTAVGGIERRIIDPETGKGRPPGEIGTLSLRGGALMTGMHRKEHAEVFDPDGFYRTDDLCRMDEDGHLYFTGRGSDMLKISGANVSPAEVERAIRNESAVKEVCVLGLANEDGGDMLVAAVITEIGADLSPVGMRSRLKAQMSSYKVPRHIFFIQEQEMPMTASGKIYKPELRRLLAGKIGH